MAFLLILCFFLHKLSQKYLEFIKKNQDKALAKLQIQHL